MHQRTERDARLAKNIRRPGIEFDVGSEVADSAGCRVVVLVERV